MDLVTEPKGDKLKSVDQKLSRRSISLIALMILPALGVGCSSMSSLPKEDNVKISRAPADKDCELLSKVEGRSMSKNGNEEDTLKDLRQEAANKGANFLVVKEFSSMGTSATGLAYRCP